MNMNIESMNITDTLSPALLSNTKSTSLKKITTFQKQIKILNSRIDILSSQNIHLQQMLNDVLIKCDDMSKLIKNNERYIVQQDSYSRRNNIEFCNIPETIHQKELEQFIIKMLNTAGINISSYNIVAVHRVGKKKRNRPRNVIVRFVNRKDTYRCFGISKKLQRTGYNNIYTVENLCPYNRRLFNALYKLKKNNAIHSVWSHNGQIYYQLDEADDNSIKVESLDDIQYLFEDTKISADEEFEDINRWSD